jgi:LPXTG-motif cell wall-anchored protein
MLTATAAGTLLGALWFVPSANATVDAPARAAASAAPTTQVLAERQADAGRAGTGSQARYETTSSARDATELADTGSIDTTPYVVGGTLFLGVGAGFVVYSVRRERLGF